MNDQSNPWQLTLSDSQGNDWHIEILVILPIDKDEKQVYILFTDVTTGTEKTEETPVYAAILNTSDGSISNISSDDDVWNLFAEVLAEILTETQANLLIDEDDE